MDDERPPVSPELPGPLGNSRSVRYLLDAGLLGGEQVVGGVRVLTSWGRSGGVRVICSRGQSYFLKQASSSENRRWLKREASVYRWLHGRPHAAPSIPAFYIFDPGHGVMVLGLEPDARSQWALDAGDRHPPRIEAAHVAAALARLHKLEWDTAIPAPPGLESNSVPHARWLADLPAVDLDIASESSAAALEAIRLIQADADFCRMLRGLRDEWDERGPIHGDVRAANILVRRPVAEQWRITLLDWEAAGLGDPCWDVGCYFSAFLNRWVRSMPFGPGADLNQVASRAVCPLSSMQPAVRAFWETYVGMMSLGPAGANEWLLRAVRMAALRLLQMTLEAARTSADLAPQDYAEVQLARNILERPAEAARHLLGVTA